MPYLQSLDQSQRRLFQQNRHSSPLEEKVIEMHQVSLPCIAILLLVLINVMCQLCVL